MKSVRYACCLLFVGTVLAGCQSTGSTKEQLTAICADPSNRLPQSFYYTECQQFQPPSIKTQQKNYLYAR